MDDPTTTPDPSLTDANFRAPAAHADPTTTPSGPKIPNTEGHGQVLGSEDGLAAAADIQAKVQEVEDEAKANGYLGHNPDPKSNDEYTLSRNLAGGDVVAIERDHLAGEEPAEGEPATGEPTGEPAAVATLPDGTPAFPQEGQPGSSGN